MGVASEGGEHRAVIRDGTRGFITNFGHRRFALQYTSREFGGVSMWGVVDVVQTVSHCC